MNPDNDSTHITIITKQQQRYYNREYYYKPRCVKCNIKLDDHKEGMPIPRCPECHGKMRTRSFDHWGRRVRDRLEKAGRIKRY